MVSEEAQKSHHLVTLSLESGSRKVVASFSPHSHALVQLAAAHFESLPRVRILLLRAARCPASVEDLASTQVVHLPCHTMVTAA